MQSGQRNAGACKSSLAKRRRRRRRRRLPEARMEGGKAGRASVVCVWLAGPGPGPSEGSNPWCHRIPREVRRMSEAQLTSSSRWFQPCRQHLQPNKSPRPPSGGEKGHFRCSRT